MSYIAYCNQRNSFTAYFCWKNAFHVKNFVSITKQIKCFHLVFLGSGVMYIVICLVLSFVLWTDLWWTMVFLAMPSASAFQLHNHEMCTWISMRELLFSLLTEDYFKNMPHSTFEYWMCIWTCCIYISCSVFITDMRGKLWSTSIIR